jgi:hypothetical protein
MHDQGQSPTDDEAATWPRNQPIAGLQRRFLISPAGALESNEAFKRLNRYTDEGHIVRTVGTGGRSGVTTLNSAVHQPGPRGNLLAALRGKELLRRCRTPVRHRLNTVNAPVQPCSFPALCPRSLELRRASQFSAAAVTIAWFGIRIFAQHGATLTRAAAACSQIAAPRPARRHPGPCPAGHDPVGVHRAIEGVAWRCRRDDPHDNRWSCNPQHCGARQDCRRDRHANRTVSNGCAARRSAPARDHDDAVTEQIACASSVRPETRCPSVPANSKRQHGAVTGLHADRAARDCDPTGEVFADACHTPFPHAFPCPAGLLAAPLWSSG